MRRLALIAAAALAGCSAPPSACDRDCLLDIADAYLDAIASRDPAAAPLAADIAFFENVERLEPGQGLWATAAGPANRLRIPVPDTEQGTIGMITVVPRESGGGLVPALVAFHLTVEDGLIVEAEHLVADATEDAVPSLLNLPRPAMIADVPEGERMPRDELARIADAYYEALDKSDASLAPYASDCERVENGMVTAGPALPPAAFDSVDVNGRSPPRVDRDCIGQVNSRRFAYIDSIDNRRIVAVDPVRGLAMGFSHFRQSMARGPHRMIAADGSELMWEEQREPYDLPAAHIFKITDGMIHEVEAIGIFIPYASPLVE